MRGLSPVAASGGHASSPCVGLSLSRPLLSRSTGCRRAGSVVVVHGPSCSTACGIFPDQGSNPCPLHWQADSQPLSHQGSPVVFFISSFCFASNHALNFTIKELFKNVKAGTGSKWWQAGDPRGRCNPSPATRASRPAHDARDGGCVRGRPPCRWPSVLSLGSSVSWL